METTWHTVNLSLATPLMKIDPPCTSSYPMLIASQLEVAFVPSYLLQAGILSDCNLHVAPIAVCSDVQLPCWVW